jgi:hydroxymethylpyrimidine/phosphomethylpyrimidine kinase
MRSPAVALTIAGSDSSAGAGLQADLKAFTACGVYGLTVATAIVAERPGAVLSVEEVSAKSIREQIQAVLPHYPVAAIKTGLLPSAKAIAVVREALQHHPAPLVIDPVAVASAGTSLASPDAQDALRTLIRDRAHLVTPNRVEAEHFLGASITSADQAREAATALRGLFGCAVLLKGGHFEGPEAIDWLATDELHEIHAPRLQGIDVHGTGCAYSAAIAGRLALGISLVEAVRDARRYLQSALERHSVWATADGSGIKALAHVAEP